MLKNLYQAVARYSKWCYPCTYIFCFQNCRNRHFCILIQSITLCAIYLIFLEIHLALLLHTFIYTAFTLNAFYTFVLLLYFIAFIQFITFCVFIYVCALPLLNSALMLYRYFSSFFAGDPLIQRILHEWTCTTGVTTTILKHTDKYHPNDDVSSFSLLFWFLLLYVWFSLPGKILF